MNDHATFELHRDSPAMKVKGKPWNWTLVIEEAEILDLTIPVPDLVCKSTLPLDQFDPDVKKITDAHKYQSHPYNRNIKAHQTSE